IFCIEEILGFAPLEGAPFVWFTSAPIHRGTPYLTFNPQENIELSFEGLPIHKLLFAKTMIEAQKYVERFIMSDIIPTQTAEAPAVQGEAVPAVVTDTPKKGEEHDPLLGDVTVQTEQQTV